MKAVVDTNVLVPGLLKPYGPPGTIVRMLASGQLQLVYDARIVAEYREVSACPLFGFKPAEVEPLLNYVMDAGIAVASGPLAIHLPDAGDEPFLEAALAAEDAVLVTGSLKHFPPELRSGIRVYSPAEFLAYFLRA